MSDVILNIVLSIATTIFGIVVGLMVDSFRNKYRFKRELEQNNHIDITGDDWYAAWQTSVEKQEVLNTERLSIVQKGQTVNIRNFEKSPENPKGGYLWEGQMQFFYGKSLMGWYFPVKSENLTSKGMMFFAYHSTRRTFIGKWVGSAYDGDLVNGFVVITKDRQRSMETLKEIVQKHPDTINIVYDTF